MNNLGRILVIFFKAICLSFFLFGTGCTHPVTKADVDENGIRIVDIKTGLSNTKVLNLSYIASNIEYCTLETDDHCFVRYPGMQVYCSNDYIVTIGSQALMYRPVCFVFDRKTGKYIREISRYGQGPNEYTEIRELYWDRDREQICLVRNMNYCFYNIDGTLSHKIPHSPPGIGFDCIAYKDYLVSYFPGNPKNSRPRIAFIDINGNYIDTIPEYRKVKRDNDNMPYTVSSGNGQVYIFQDSLYYKDIFCDTLYQIQDFTLQPRYIFNTGGLAVPFEIQSEGRFDLRSLFNGGDEIDLWEKYILISKINESNNHIYFTIEYRRQLFTAIYEKSQNNLQIMNPVNLLTTRQSRERILQYGFQNDLDGGLPFWPQQMISDKEMMCVYTAEELLELDASKITDEKLKNLLNSLEEDDNPVVAIVTLKDY